MKKLICLAVVCMMAAVNVASADTFGTGANQFTIDFVNISGDASSANGTNISPWLPSQDGYKTFTDPGNDYRIGKFEITNDQWSKFKSACDTLTGDSHWTGSNVPTNSVNWYEAAQFVNYLNTSTGHQAAYKFTGTQGTSNYTFDIWNASDTGYNPSNPYRNSNAFYFLPTEDEWVKAAYWNGTSLQIHATKPGESLTQGNGTSGTGWNYYNNGYATNPYGPWAIGSGSEELNGTFDMMGNIIEWMEGLYHSEGYSANSHRIVRGGAYNNEKEPFGSLYDGYDTLESTFRIWDCHPDAESYTIGFRVASEPTFTLSVQVEPGDIGINTVTPSIGVHVYDASQTVNLAALPYIQCPSVYRFDHWTGEVANPNSANTTVLMDADKVVTAVFVLAIPVCGDQCHPNFTVGDLNHDCIVDLGDFAILASRWMNCTKPECDEGLPPADTEPPMPNPAAWATQPYQNNPNSIRMVAATAVDPEGNGVQYAFYCSENPALNSGWINNAEYVASGLILGQTYTFQVKYRDNSMNQNETAFSSAVAVTIVEIDMNPPMPNPPILKAQKILSGYQWYHILTAYVVTDPSGVEYQYRCVDVPGLIANGVSVDWVNAGNTLNGIYPFGLTYYPNSQLKVPNVIWIPVPGIGNHTYQVRARDQSPNQNAGEWSLAITTQ
jgi:hypothetical protein